MLLKYLSVQPEILESGQGRQQAGRIPELCVIHQPRQRSTRGRRFVPERFLAIYFPVVGSRTSLCLNLFFLQSLLNVGYVKFRVSEVYGIKKLVLDK